MIYHLFVYCRRDGVSCDSGLHARCEVSTDQEAITILRKEGQWLLNFYDYVGCSIIQPTHGDDLKYQGEGRKVSNFTLHPLQNSCTSNRRTCAKI